MIFAIPIHAAVTARDSAPSPDIMVLRYRDDFYAHANPQPGDI